MAARRSHEPASVPHGWSTSAHITSWGSHAERFVQRHASAVLVAVFARSLYLEAESDFLCIGDTSIGKGPLNATVDLADWEWIAKGLPSSGTRVLINTTSIEIGNAALLTSRASTWRPPVWPHIVSIERLAEALCELERCTREKLPVEGLARLVLTPFGKPVTALDRIARPRINRLQRWARARLSRSQTGPPPIDLLGLGPGLTPSGDDLLCGALVALHAIGAVDASRDLAAAIVAATPSATSRLSGAVLRAAAEGCGSETLLTAIISLLKNVSVESNIDALTRMGHTSGWDALAGATIMLQAFSFDRHWGW